MSFKSYNPHQRYKERAAYRLSSTLAYLAVILISGLIGFWLGKQYAAEQLIIAQTKVKTYVRAEREQQERITELSTMAQTANMRYEKLKETVESAAPAGNAQGLIKLITDQLAKGADADRLAYLIKSGRPPTDCKEPETKRFVVATPLYKGPKSEVEIAEGLIKISGKGDSSKNEEGKPEVWYDPGQRVNIAFLHNGKTDLKKGVMPLRKTIVVNGREYRFTVEPGAQSFAKVIYDSCAYP